MKMRKILAMLSVLAMLCTLLPFGAMVSAATVVVSYDFEDGTTAWGGTVIDDNGGKAIQWDANGYGYLNRKPTLQANTWYKVTFDHKGDSVNALMWDGTKAVAVKQPAASADWTTQSYVFYSGEYTSLNFRFQNPSSSAKTIYLDNIKLLSERQNTICQQMELETKLKCDRMVAEAEQKSQACWENCSAKIKQLVDSFEGLQQVMDMYSSFRRKPSEQTSQISGTFY